jgi:antitoxin ParD1/3/4
VEHGGDLGGLKGTVVELRATPTMKVPAGEVRLERFVQGKVRSGLYNNASEVVREGLRVLKEIDDVRLKWREQIERGWLQAQAGPLAEGTTTLAQIRGRLKSRAKKRA